VRTLGIVPAKATSRRLPGKNLLDFGGFPLWCHAAIQAKEAGCAEVIVATDSEGVARPCNVHRTAFAIDHMPESLGWDDNRVEWTVRYVLDKYQRILGPFDVAVVLNPTHPLRHVEDIKACIDSCGVWPSCTGVRRDFTYTVPEGARLETMNAQDRVPRLVVTGAIYAVRVPAFMEFGKLMIYGNVTRGTWHEEKGPYIDIDTMDDYIAAKALYEHYHKAEVKA
jgi:CMP-N-acetylneuraminic acid synthetase